MYGILSMTLYYRMLFLGNKMLKWADTLIKNGMPPALYSNQGMILKVFWSVVYICFAAEEEGNKIPSTCLIARQMRNCLKPWPRFLFGYIVFNSVLKKFKIYQEVVRVMVVIIIAHIFFFIFKWRGNYRYGI